jgi:hypothetical protein
MAINCVNVSTSETYESLTLHNFFFYSLMLCENENYVKFKKFVSSFQHWAFVYTHLMIMAIMKMNIIMGWEIEVGCYLYHILWLLSKVKWMTFSYCL